MNRTTAIFLIVALLAGCCYAQMPNSPYDKLRDFNTVSVLAGGHLSVMYSGTIAFTAPGQTQTSPWLVIGYAPNLSDDNLRRIGSFGPSAFTLCVVATSSGDSVGIKEIYFEWSLDTTQIAHINGDSSNWVVSAGAQNSIWYGIWQFSPIRRPTPTVGFVYPVRVLAPGYIRFKFTSSPDVSDLTSIQWKLVGMRP